MSTPPPLCLGLKKWAVAGVCEKKSDVFKTPKKVTCRRGVRKKRNPTEPRPRRGQAYQNQVKNLWDFSFWLLSSRNPTPLPLCFYFRPLEGYAPGCRKLFFCSCNLVVCDEFIPNIRFLVLSPQATKYTMGPALETVHEEHGRPAVWL